MQPRSIGNISIRSVVEEDGPAGAPLEYFAEATPQAMAPHLEWLPASAYDRESNQLLGPIQSYVVNTEHHTVVIDTCTGNHKRHEPVSPQFHMRTDYTWLEDLVRAGVDPASVDYVFCTHLHFDHVGWNTRLVDGRWVPTFPNARYVFAKRELEWSEARVKSIQDWTYEDSVLPVLEAGQAEIVDTDFALDDNLWLEPTPGHTPGHVAVRIRSRGENAVMSGDLIHHPIQLAHPEWSPIFDADPDLARATRRRFLEQQCDQDILMMTAHFPLPSAGYVTRHGDAFRFRYVEE